MKEQQRWHSSRPPRIGWYPASTERDPNARRYWHGRVWSAPCHAEDPPEIADRVASHAADTYGAPIEWLMPQ